MKYGRKRSRSLHPPQTNSTSGSSLSSSATARRSSHIRVTGCDHARSVSDRHEPATEKLVVHRGLPGARQAVDPVVPLCHRARCMEARLRAHHPRRRAGDGRVVRRHAAYVQWKHAFERITHGIAPVTDRWFVVNAADAQWIHHPDFGWQSRSRRTAPSSASARTSSPCAFRRSGSTSRCSPADALREYQQTPLLILDDLGAEARRDGSRVERRTAFRHR